MKSFVTLVASVLLLTPLVHAMDTQDAHEFDGMCAGGLMLGKEVRTDCKINWTDTSTKKTYCFSSEEMRNSWTTDVANNRKQSELNYAKAHAATSQSAQISKTM